MDQTGNSFGSNPASLKGKLQTLEVPISLPSNKSKIFRINLIITRRKCKSWEVKKILWSLSSPWRQLMSRKACPMSSSAYNKRCKMKLILGKDISISRRQRIAGSNSRSLHWKARRQPSNNNSSAFREESPNYKCKSEAMPIDHLTLLF